MKQLAVVFTLTTALAGSIVPIRARADEARGVVANIAEHVISFQEK